jgi:hypothetical protein
MEEWRRDRQEILEQNAAKKDKVVDKNNSNTNQRSDKDKGSNGNQ